MEVIRTDRGFEVIMHPKYANEEAKARLAQQSSAIGNYPDAMVKPGSSFLWVGEHHHLSREEVLELVQHLQAWLTDGSLEMKE